MLSSFFAGFPSYALLGPVSGLWLLSLFFVHAALVVLFVRQVVRARRRVVRSLVGVPCGVG